MQHGTAPTRSLLSLRNYRVATLCVLIAATGPSPTFAHDARPSARPHAIAAGFGATPARFEENVGQMDPRARFVMRGGGYRLFLTSDGAVLSFPGGPSNGLRMRFAGASADAAIAGEEPLAGTSNYLIGSDPSRWRTGVPGYARVRYSGVYPGVDMVYYGAPGAGGDVEYDFVVAPGADARRIGVAIDGADSVEVDASGDLVLRTAAGELRQRAPVVYQDTPDGRRYVPARYRLENDVVRFDVSTYDRALALVIDPVLSYSTYLGGADVDRAFAIAVDGTGAAYVAGFTSSADFPLASPLQQVNAGMDAFVAKLAPSGSALVYATYLGGSGADMARALALAATGEVYVAGTTDSANFPTGLTGMSRRGLGVDAFVVRIAANGGSLVYSAAFGGDGTDTPNGIAIDGDGSAYVTGQTDSNDYPTQNPIQIHSGEGNEDAFVSKLNDTGVVFFYSTYLGGSDSDTGLAIAVDGSGNAFVVGGTDSNNFPTRSAFQNDKGGARDAFVTEVASTGTALVFSTFLGGTASDTARSVALDSAGAVYVTGETFSSDFPTEAPLQADPGGGGDAFLTKFASGGGSLDYSTYIGGGQEDQANAIVVDAAGAAYLTGFTHSRNFPTQLPIQTDPDDTLSDAFVAKVTVNGTRLAYSTYLGGNGDDRGDAIAIDDSGGAYVTGMTAATNFPLQSPVHSDRAVEDAFVTKIANAVVEVSIGATAAPSPVNSGSQLSYTVAVSNTGVDEAGDVILTMATPAGTTFASVTEPEGAECTTPPPGGTGPITCRIGTIPGGGSAMVTIVVNVTAPEGTQLTFNASASTTATDTNPTNNATSVQTDVIRAVDPPIVTSVSKLVVAGKPYRIKISGSNFQTGIQVFVGSDATPWPSVKNKGGTMLILKGTDLKTRFPKGVPTSIRLVNPDGGEATTSFTR